MALPSMRRCTYSRSLFICSDDRNCTATFTQECPNEHSAVRQAEAMSRKPPNVGALAFKRTGDPNLGNFGDATVLKTFGEVPSKLDEL